jgi:hypothetical protein
VLTVTLAAVAAGAVLGVPVAPATTVQQYCGPTWVDAYARCPLSSSRHSWETNTSNSNMNGPWPMCERIEDYDNGNVIYSRVCANKVSVSGYWDDYCGGCHDHVNDGTLLRCWAGNKHAMAGESDRQSRVQPLLGGRRCDSLRS